MARKTNTTDTAFVQVYERQYANGKVRFYLTYTMDGTQQRELLENIPAVYKKDRRAYKEADAFAHKIAAERMEDIRKGQLGITNKHSNILLADWIEHCADRAEEHAVAGGSRNTWARMLRQTAIMVRSYGGDTKMSRVDKPFVRGFIDYLSKEYTTKQGKHFLPKTADKYYGCLRFALNEAKREEMISVNPCELISSNDKIKVPEANRGFLTVEELLAMIGTPTQSERTRQVFLFMCFCGLRISDAKQLRWSNIVKDGDDWIICKVTQKTQKAAYLPLNKTARSFMPEQGESDVVFYDLPQEPAMNRALKTWAKNAGVNKTVTLHTGRHTYGTLLQTLGVDLYTTSELMTHSNINVTKIYAKIVDEKKRAAVYSLDKILDKAKGKELDINLDDLSEEQLRNLAKRIEEKLKKK